MHTKNPYLSLVLPCYNEAEHIIRSVDSIIQVLKTLPYKFEVIFIDDKSQDQIIKFGTTKEILSYSIKKYPSCLIIPSKLHFMEEEAMEEWK